MWYVFVIASIRFSAVGLLFAMFGRDDFAGGFDSIAVMIAYCLLTLVVSPGTSLLALSADALCDGRSVLRSHSLSEIVSSVESSLDACGVSAMANDSW